MAAACGRHTLNPVELDLGHLLGDAVDVAAAVSDLSGHNGLDGVAGEHLLSLLNSQSVVLIAVLGQDDGVVGDQEVHVGSNGDLAFLTGNGTGSGVDGPCILQVAGFLGHAHLVDLQLAALGIGSLGQGLVSSLEFILRMQGSHGSVLNEDVGQMMSTFGVYAE